MKKVFLIILIVSTVGCAKKIYTSNEYFDCNTTADFKADTDKKQLIYKILDRAVVSMKDIKDYHLISDKDKIYIKDIAYSRFFGGLEKPSETPIENSEVPGTIKDVRFCVKSKSELQEIADRTDDFVYLTLGNIEINGETAKIGITSSWSIRDQKTRQLVIMSGGGYVLEYKKTNGVWEFEKTILNFQF